MILLNIQIKKWHFHFISYTSHSEQSKVRDNDSVKNQFLASCIPGSESPVKPCFFFPSINGVIFRALLEWNLRKSENPCIQCVLCMFVKPLHSSTHTPEATQLPRLQCAQVNLLRLHFHRINCGLLNSHFLRGFSSVKLHIHNLSTPRLFLPRTFKRCHSRRSRLCSCLQRNSNGSAASWV